MLSAEPLEEETTSCGEAAGVYKSEQNLPRRETYSFH